jgi:hypothetical protein
MCSRYESSNFVPGVTGFMFPIELEQDSSNITYYADPPSYQEFLDEHLIKNEPALIGPPLTTAWKARKEWIQPLRRQSPNDQPCDIPKPITEPNFQFLLQEFGHARVQVADCLERDFTDQKRGDMTFADFVEKWRSTDPECTGRYYLKDWHFVKAFPDYKAYDVPGIFEGIWWFSSRNLL